MKNSFIGIKYVLILKKNVLTENNRLNKIKACVFKCFPSYSYQFLTVFVSIINAGQYNCL